MVNFIIVCLVIIFIGFLCSMVNSAIEKVKEASKIIKDEFKKDKK